jgi:hypothetical protein
VFGRFHTLDAVRKHFASLLARFPHKSGLAPKAQVRCVACLYVLVYGSRGSRWGGRADQELGTHLAKHHPLSVAAPHARILHMHATRARAR